MSAKFFRRVLHPRSVVVIGASAESNTIGGRVMHNLLAADFKGTILPVSVNARKVCGVRTKPDLRKLKGAPDLAIICDINDVSAIQAEELVQSACTTVMVLCACDPERLASFLAVLKEYGVRVIGAHALGMIVPAIGLNASVANTLVLPGKIAFISQSAAICNATLEWARERKVGFSHVLGLGDSTDIDIADMLDCLAKDGRSRAILLHVDNIQDGRAFMSAARAAASIKPVVVLKAGRYLPLTDMHVSRSESYTPDVVYDAAFKRSGMLRVQELQELFAAAETLAHGKPLGGERLAILANGAGPAALAVDTLLANGGRLATLSQETRESIQAYCLPSPHTEALVVTNDTINNITNNTIKGDISHQFEQVFKALVNDDNIDNLLIIHAPSISESPLQSAEDLVQSYKALGRTSVNIFVHWMGDTSFRATHDTFSQAGIAAYRILENAVKAFIYMLRHRRNQKLLMQIPESRESDILDGIQQAKALIADWIKQRQLRLDTEQANRLLACYGISSVMTRKCATLAALENIADEIGYPLALKIDCPELEHAAKVGGVKLNIKNVEQLKATAQSMQTQIAKEQPDLNLRGFVLQQMAEHDYAHELRITVACDPTFGPVFYLGEGAHNWQVQRDAVVGFPPLNHNLARYLIVQALAEDKVRDRHRHRALDRDGLATLLCRLSQLLLDHPEVASLDINPVLAAAEQFCVLDINLQLQAHSAKQVRYAIRPYPKDLEKIVTLKDGQQVLIRPIRSEDWSTQLAFDEALSPEDRYKRYFGEVPTLDEAQLAKLTQIDYEREMSLIALSVAGDTSDQILAVANIYLEPDKSEAEFAIAVRSDLKSKGLGKQLMLQIIDYCRSQSVQNLTGMTMLTNQSMAILAKNLGFELTRDMEERVLLMTLNMKTNMNMKTNLKST